ncbi:hypothetical protein MPH_09072 [Macrophomina phaseolina MS6]|uniref:Uncharacterized protein n=1 Tax=Macrophomina phaseolina (strain MS6) TaxID=1126212 RepID=K2RGN7_MACPH|nr:hypothetical protein MPH_09072 [Macrophomina phaseolina MS6]
MGRGRFLALQKHLFEFLDGAIASDDASLDPVDRHGMRSPVVLEARLEPLEQVRQARRPFHHPIHLVILAFVRGVVRHEALADGQSEGDDADSAAGDRERVRHAKGRRVCAVRTS